MSEIGPGQARAEAMGIRGAISMAKTCNHFGGRMESILEGQCPDCEEPLSIRGEFGVCDCCSRGLALSSSELRYLNPETGWIHVAPVAQREGRLMVTGSWREEPQPANREG